jgi:hypothetical protein
MVGRTLWPNAEPFREGDDGDRLELATFATGQHGVWSCLDDFDPGRADVISTTPTLPILGQAYTAFPDTDCFPLAGLCVAGGTITLVGPVTQTFNPQGQDLMSGAVFAGELTDLSADPLGPVTLTGSIDQEVLGRFTSTATGSWTTNLVSLSLSGPVMGHTLSLELDSGNTSSGTTSIVANGAEGYLISSFFDVYVDLSLDTEPPLNTGRGPIELVLTPEPAELALLLVPALALATARLRRPVRAQSAARATASS